MRFDFAVHLGIYSVFPSVLKHYSVDFLKYVDAEWWKPNLEDGIRIVPEGFRSQVGKRSAIIFEGMENCFTILNVRTNKNVEVFSGARFRVNTYGIAAYDKVFNAVRVERE